MYKVNFLLYQNFILFFVTLFNENGYRLAILKHSHLVGFDTRSFECGDCKGIETHAQQVKIAQLKLFPPK